MWTQKSGRPKCGVLAPSEEPLQHIQYLCMIFKRPEETVVREARTSRLLCWRGEWGPRARTLCLCHSTRPQQQVVGKWNAQDLGPVKVEAQTSLRHLQTLLSSIHFFLHLPTFPTLEDQASKQAISGNCLACGQDVKYFQHSNPATTVISGLFYAHTEVWGPNVNTFLITTLFPEWQENIF